MAVTPFWHYFHDLAPVFIQDEFFHFLAFLFRLDYIALKIYNLIEILIIEFADVIKKFPYRTLIPNRTLIRYARAGTKLTFHKVTFFAPSQQFSNLGYMYCKIYNL